MYKQTACREQWNIRPLLSTGTYTLQNAVITAVTTTQYTNAIPTGKGDLFCRDSYNKHV